MLMSDANIHLVNDWIHANTDAAAHASQPVGCAALSNCSCAAAEGARRFSAGGSLFQTSYAYSRLKAKAFIGAGDVSGLFEHSLPYAFMNASIAGQ